MKKKPTRFVVPLLGSIALLLTPAHGVEIGKLQNNTALNLTGAWNGGVVPGVGDVMVWNNLYTAPGAVGTLSQLGADLSVLGLKVTNVGGAANAVTTMVGFQNTSSANTLTIGAGGIDLSAATQALMIQSKVTIGASQNWVINNSNTSTNPGGFNNGEDLAFQAFSGTTTAANTAFNLGGNTVTTSGTGQVTITSGYALANGTINIGNNLFLIGGGNSRLTTVGADVNLNVASGSTLHFQSNSAAVTSAANITLNGGTLKLVSNNATNLVTINGTVNVGSASTLLVGNNVGNGSVLITAAGAGLMLNASLTGAANLAVTNNASTANALILAGNNSGYSGTLTLGGTAGRVSRLTSANAGSAAATWNIASGHTLQINGLNVNLGTLAGAGTVNSFTGASTINVGAGTFSGTLTNGAGTLALTKNTAGTLTLSGGSSYTGATTVSAGTLLVAPGTLSGTAVSVAGGATYAAQASFAGLLSTDVNVAAGGTMLARPLVAGAGSTLPSLTVAATGSVTFDTGVLGNPTAAPLTATIFTPTAGTTLRFIGSNLAPGTFPALAYSGAIGGGGFAGLGLALPFRITGGLVNNAGSVDVTITGTAKPAWRGNVNGNWNIDTVGDGSAGTANWLAASGPNTYVEALVGTDSAVFDDTATGTRNVTLTTTLTPGGVAVANSGPGYIFSGTGRITGPGALIKTGTGALTVVNTGTNDFTGGAFLSDGTVTLGDGATAGAGTLGTGSVTLNAPGTLEFNRAETFTFANAITGTGSLKNSQASTVTLSAATNVSAANLAAGMLRFTGGGTLSGAVTGAGALTVAGGTLQLSGNDANTFAGLTTVSSGALQLNKTAGVDAIGGNLLVTGTGGLAFFQPNQIPDAATVTYDKTINGGSLTFNQIETIGALTILNGHDTGAQVLSNTASFGFQVAGLVTVQNTGVYSVASNSSAGVGGLNLSGSSTVRVSANSNPTTLNVGALGIAASGGTIQVGQGTGAFDAVLNLGGDVTTTGNLAITDGGFTGGNLRQLNLGATLHAFIIATGTTTTIAPDIAGTGGITKAGNGTLQLTAASASNYTGATTVLAGTFLTTPAQTAASVSVAGGATLGVNLAFAGTTLTATDVTTAAASTLQFATGALGNPAAPVLAAGVFTIDGPTAIRLTGTALTSGTGIPLIGYTSLGGTAGFAGLSVVLPTRLAGTLINNPVDSRVDLDLSVEQAKWSGGVNGNWDIDPDGTGGSGTLNWRTTVANTATRYFQGPPVNTDTANFDDTATGTTTVALTTALTPVATVVNNVAKTYTFTGAGTLAGATSLTKSGAGTLILTNVTPYNHTGGTAINDGTLQVGDGVTPGVGALPSTAVTNNATVVLNRPDDFTVATTVNGLGLISKQGANTATFGLATNYAGGINAAAGTLAFSAAGNLSGAVMTNGGTLQLNGGGTLSGSILLSAGKVKLAAGGTVSGAMGGAGEFEAAGGTVLINGGTANTNTGLTTISGGTLQLNKAGGEAIAGDIRITGAGVLAILGTEQIADTATINFTGTSADATVGSTGFETVANLICNPSVGTGQFQLRNGFTVAGMATLNGGVLGVSSGHTTTLNAVNMTGGILRIAGNTAASVMNIGAGGITASGGDIQVKFNTANMDATLNLGGDVTASGNLTFSNAGYTGGNLNVINLTATRTFNIAAATATSIAPDLAGVGGLTKTGNGTLTLTALSSGSYAGPTTVSAGTLALAGGASIADTGAVSLANVAGATLLLGAGETIGSLSGGGALGGEVALGGNTLTVGDATPVTTFAGTISGAGGAVVKQGSGALNLNGPQNYGALTATAGVTNVGGSFTNGTAVVTANAPVNFSASQSIGSLNIADGVTVVFGDGLAFASGPENFSAAVVPEPGSAALLLGGLAALGLRRRRTA